MKYLNLILAAVTILCSTLNISCSKTLEKIPSEQQIELPVFSGTYKNDTLYFINKPVLHTMNGSITDESIVAEYLERQDLAWYFYLNSPTIKVPEGEGFQITFDSTNQFKLDITGMEPMDTTGTIESVDANKVVVHIYNQENTQLPVESSCAVKVRLASEVQIYDSCTSTYDGMQTCRYKFLAPLNRRQEDLELPFLIATMSQGNSGESFCKYGVTGGHWNNVNPNLNSELMPGDTVVTQIHTLRLVKQ